MADLQAALKRLRVSQPFNAVATSLARGALDLLGLRSEFLIRHLHRAGEVRCRLPNGRTLVMWSRGDDWISNQVFWRGWSGYEPETVPVFYRLATQARTTLDVGAYVGFYALLAAHANPGGLVYAFEPHPAIFPRLEDNVALNCLRNLRCVRAAAGERDGEAELFHVAGEMPSSSSLSQAFMRSAPGLRTSRVPVLTLDGFARENALPGVDLVKIDTESTEPEVLRGMQEILRRDRPAIICEILRGRGAEASLEGILGPLGYRYYLLTPQGPQSRERIEGHCEWLNYLFTGLAPGDLAGLSGAPRTA